MADANAGFMVVGVAMVDLMVAGIGAIVTFEGEDMATVV